MTGKNRQQNVFLGVPTAVLPPYAYFSPLYFLRAMHCGIIVSTSTLKSQMFGMYLCCFSNVNILHTDNLLRRSGK